MRNSDNLYDREVFCPFYKGTRKYTIICEGPYKGTTFHLVLRGKERMLMHLQIYCCGKGCEKCLVYRAANHKYE